MEKFKEAIKRITCKYKGHNWISYRTPEDSLGSVEEVRHCMRCGHATSRWIVSYKVEINK